MIKNYNIVVNGVSYDVQVEELGSNYITQKELQVQVKPETKIDQPKREIKVPVSNITNTSSSSVGERIYAPMPGTILDVKVNAGDSIKKGQILCILEAMKMENEIMSPRDGKVESVNVSKGSSVNTGELLISIQ